MRQQDRYVKRPRMRRVTQTRKQVVHPAYYGALDKRLSRQFFKLESRVRFPYALRKSEAKVTSQKIISPAVGINGSTPCNHGEVKVKALSGGGLFIGKPGEKPVIILVHRQSINLNQNPEGGRYEKQQNLQQAHHRIPNTRRGVRRQAGSCALSQPEPGRYASPVIAPGCNLDYRTGTRMTVVIYSRALSAEFCPLMKKRKTELLAPAGSWESLRAAIQAGADAVYFGVDKLNMRAKNSVNFALDDLEQIATVCHEKGVRAYLALNTILYDHDIALSKQIVRKAKKHGIDAVIAFDQSVISFAHEAGIPVHISTQANITNAEAVKFYSAFADVMVLSRELTLEQVKSIASTIDRKKICGPSGEKVKLEIFAHGALCMAVSGKCYISLHTNFASANRGACVQNCRRKYSVRDEDSGFEFTMENEYIMSAKDLCTISFLDQVIASGASVLKIEGRGRSEDYVHTVTRCYREAIDSVYEGNFTKEKAQAWEERLRTVFNRGFWDGYYLGRKLGEWHDTDGSAATGKKIFLGRTSHYFPKAGVAEIRMETGSLAVGDEIMVSGPVTGVIFTRVEEIRKDDVQKENAEKGETISIPLNQKVRPSDRVYKMIPRT